MKLNRLQEKLGDVLQEIADSGHDLSKITGWVYIDDKIGEEIPMTGEVCAKELFAMLEDKTLL